MRPADRERRLQALEAEAARRAKVEDGLDWSLFNVEQLAALLETVEAGTLSEAEIEARLAAVPGMAGAVEQAFAERDARLARR